MTPFFGTDLLSRLRWKHLLPNRLDWLDIHSAETETWLSKLDRGCQVPLAPDIRERDLEKLIEWQLISVEEPFPEYRRSLPFPFVSAINLELTYDCAITCPHCLQQNIRPRLLGTWLPAQTANRAVLEGWFAGLLSTGVNITGGEIFTSESTLPELLKATKSQELPVRVNTNGWWGNKKNIKLGSRKFSTARELMRWLQRMGVSILALSVDERSKLYPDLWASVVALIRECELIGQDYQVICTGATSGSIDEIYRQTTRDAKLTLKHMLPVPMEMIDIGGAAKDSDLPFHPMRLALVPRHSPCGTLGFTRPSLLHVSPDGGLRSCLYAVGAASYGNLNHESLLHIINHISTNPVVDFFRGDNFEPFVRKYFEPFAPLYRIADHPCAVSAILVRMVEEVENAISRNKADPSSEELHSIHNRIALDFNLRSEVEA